MSGATTKQQKAEQDREEAEMKIAEVGWFKTVNFYKSAIFCSLDFNQVYHVHALVYYVQSNKFENFKKNNFLNP